MWPHNIRLYSPPPGMVMVDVRLYVRMHERKWAKFRAAKSKWNGFKRVNNLLCFQWDWFG